MIKGHEPDKPCYLIMTEQKLSFFFVKNRFRFCIFDYIRFITDENNF